MSEFNNRRKNKGVSYLWAIFLGGFGVRKYPGLVVNRVVAWIPELIAPGAALAVERDPAFGSH